MPQPISITQLLAVAFKELAYSLADEFISGDLAADYVKLAADILEEGADLHTNLEKLLADVQAAKKAAAERGEEWRPTDEEIAAKLSEIANRRYGDNPTAAETGALTAPVLTTDAAMPGSDKTSVMTFEGDEVVGIGVVDNADPPAQSLQGVKVHREDNVFTGDGGGTVVGPSKE